MKREILSRKIAEEGIVLLKNENNILPFSKKNAIPVFGKGQNQFYKAGRGSGDVNSEYFVSITEGIKNSGFILNDEIEMAYKNKTRITEKQILSASKKSDTAFLIISRNSTEFWDRNIKDDFILDREETKLLYQLENSNFKHIVLILNIAGLIDVSFLEKCKKIDAIILAWLPGMEGGNAVADLISGAVNPSGHICDTFAYSYDMYPCAKNHHYFADTVYYEEDIFTGYRYFETVAEAKQNVAFPFGFGLSYTKFSFSNINCSENEENISVSVLVDNVGIYSGKEVVQLYVKMPHFKDGRPEYELKGFKKTSLLSPGRAKTVKIAFKKIELAIFDQQNGSWIVPKGKYEIYIGNNIRDIEYAGSYIQGETQTVLHTGCKLNCQLPSHLTEGGEMQKTEYMDKREYAASSPFCKFISEEDLSIKHGNHTLLDVRDRKISLSKFISELSVVEKINLCQAQPPSLPRGTSGIGNNHSRRIPNIQTADGPAGLRVSTATTCFPCATLVACTWNEGLQYNMGKAMAEECVEHNIDILLAPALNIHRDPLCGRNFEYYSEDPLVSGKTAAAVVKGIQSMGVSATIKHFICNNQERFRIFSNSVVSERALREIYLKGFEIAVKEGKPDCLMTSYNKVNEIRTSSNFALLTGILRFEWGYNGAVMTDWRTDSHLFEEINAGNNIKMPCGYPDEIKLAINYASYNNVDIKQLDKSVEYILKLIMKSNRFKTENFGIISKISKSAETRIPALNLNYVSHTFAGIEKCSDIGGGRNLRRLEKDIRGNDCYVGYTLEAEEDRNYGLSVRFSAENSSSYMDIVIDNIPVGTIHGLKPDEESREWDEDDSNDPHTPKKWVTSNVVNINLTAGQHDFVIYIRTEKPRQTMSINYITFKRFGK